MNGHDRMHDYIDDRLSVDERRAFEELLAGDDRLRRRVEELSADREALREGDDALGPGFYTRTRAAFEASNRSRRRGVWLWPGVAAVATSLTAAAMLFVLWDEPEFREPLEEVAADASAPQAPRQDDPGAGLGSGESAREQSDRDSADSFAALGYVAGREEGEAESVETAPQTPPPAPVPPPPAPRPKRARVSEKAKKETRVVDTTAAVREEFEDAQRKSAPQAAPELERLAQRAQAGAASPSTLIDVTPVSAKLPEKDDVSDTRESKGARTDGAHDYSADFESLQLVVEPRDGLVSCAQLTARETVEGIRILLRTVRPGDPADAASGCLVRSYSGRPLLPEILPWDE